MKNRKLFAIVAIALLAFIIAIFILHSNEGGSSSKFINLSIGMPAPNYGFFSSNGSSENISQYRGHEILLWFVATWCPSCAQGNQVINSNYLFFKQHHVKIIEFELYKDLGYSGPPIQGFVNSYAPAAYANATVMPAYAGYNMTEEYDPQGYLDIYYLISKNGTILYINGSPSVTIGDLESAINSSL